RDPSRTPLFQVLFNLLSFSDAELDCVPGLEVETAQLQDRLPVQSKFDLTLYLREDSTGLSLSAVYNIKLFSAERISRLVDQFTFLLESVSTNADLKVLKASLITPSEALILPDPAAPLQSDRRLPNVVEQIRGHVRAEPDKCAVECENGLLSYLR